MTLLLFIIVLGVLVFVHEMGHFLFAKLFKIRVDEFGIGYPPKAKKIFSWKGTDFTLNWIPFGGFVKIFSKNTLDREATQKELSECIESKPRWQQLLVMLGGIIFNTVFAGIIFVILFASGFNFTKTALPEKFESDVHYVVSSVQKDSVAEQAGLGIQEKIISLSANDQELESFSHREYTEIINFIRLAIQEDKDLSLKTDKGQYHFELDEDDIMLGVSFDRHSKIDMPLYASVYYGMRESLLSFKHITLAFVNLFSGSVSSDNISGPVGIAGQVGKAAEFGWQYLFAFVALLSVNLAVLNLVPFPALDGGRILIILIESILRREINPNIVGWVNVVGFFILIALMVFVTIKDIVNIF